MLYGMVAVVLLLEGWRVMVNGKKDNVREIDGRSLNR
jgi:hypothetical protein